MGASLESTAVVLVEHEVVASRSEMLMKMKKKMSIGKKLVGEGSEG